jgi:hypothetical protein
VPGNAEKEAGKQGTEEGTQNESHCADLSGQKENGALVASLRRQRRAGLGACADGSLTHATRSVRALVKQVKEKSGEANAKKEKEKREKRERRR